MKAGSPAAWTSDSVFTTSYHGALDQAYRTGKDCAPLTILLASYPRRASASATKW